MKLVTFEPAAGGAQSIGILDGDQVAVLDATLHPSFTSMLALIEGGDEALEAARKAQGTATKVGLETVRLRAPLPEPVQMRDCLTFELHLRQCRSTMSKINPELPDLEPEDVPLPQVWYDQPVYYKGNRFSVSGMGDQILWPRGETRLDYELELGMITGKGGMDISVENAQDHVFGFLIFNDFSARDHQMLEMGGGLGPAKGKDWSTANAMGPCLVTKDEIGDGSGLAMKARVNGEEWSNGNSGTMHHSFADILAHVSRDEEIRAGEFFGSGTVGGGCGLEFNRFLSPGDVVELEIEGIGILRNKVGPRQ